MLHYWNKADFKLLDPEDIEFQHVRVTKPKHQKNIPKGTYEFHVTMMEDTVDEEGDEIWKPWPIRVLLIGDSKDVEIGRVFEPQDVADIRSGNALADYLRTCPTDPKSYSKALIKDESVLNAARMRVIRSEIVRHLNSERAAFKPSRGVNHPQVRTQIGRLQIELPANDL